MATASPSPTPNPNAMKFTLDVALPTTMNVTSAPAAVGNEFAEAVFAVGGVASLFGVNDFITVTREGDADWDPIVAAVQDAAAATVVGDVFGDREGLRLLVDGGDRGEDRRRSRRPGWDTIETCDPSTSVIVAPARSAIERCVAGGMTRSSVPTTAQLGIVFHAAVCGRRDVGAERGRTLTRDDQPPVGLGEVLRERIVHGGGLEERFGIAFRGSGVADDVQHGGGVGDLERGARSAEDAEARSHPHRG